MTRRSTPQAKTDDRAFPVRLIIRVPQGGFGHLLNDAHRWLDTAAGRPNYAWHGGGATTGRHVCAVYFRCPSLAAAFLDAIPGLELADGTCEPWYTSPNRPPGHHDEDDPVCNLYSQTRAVDAVRQLFGGQPFTNLAGNLEPGSIYPDQLAPIIRHRAGGLELARARWGMPTPPMFLKTDRDPGVTNIRNTGSPHWRRWLGPAHRCLVPVTSFAEPLGKGGGNQWFAATDGSPMFFAGIQVRGWRSVRKVKDGPTTDDLFAFLTTTPNAEVAAVHPKAMPVILTDPQTWEDWLTMPFEIASVLQRPLPDGYLNPIEAPV